MVPYWPKRIAATSKWPPNSPSVFKSFTTQFFKEPQGNQLYQLPPIIVGRLNSQKPENLISIPHCLRPSLFQHGKLSTKEKRKRGRRATN